MDGCRQNESMGAVKNENLVMYFLPLYHLFTNGWVPSEWVNGCRQKWKFGENALILLPPKDVEEFVSSSEYIYLIAFNHFLTNGSSAVNGCRQNESRNSW